MSVNVVKAGKADGKNLPTTSLGPGQMVGLLDALAAAAKKPTSKAKGVPKDLLQLVSFYAENISDGKTASEICHKLSQHLMISRFAIGGVLKRIKEEHWFHVSFVDYCENELGISKSAAYL